MRRQVLNLQRDIIEGGTKHYRYDRHAFNSFAWTAQHYSYSAETDEERDLCLFLRDMARKKSQEMMAQEQQTKAQKA